MMTISEAREIGFQEGWTACMRRKERKQPIGNPVAEMIIETVSEFYEVTKDSITGPSQKRRCVRMRGIAISLIRKYTILTLAQIARIFDRTHGSVLHAMDAHEELIKNNSKLRFDFGIIEEKVQRKLKQQ